MPVKITAFSCTWKCGRNVTTSKSRMAKHEEICFNNPKRRACQTCANLKFEWNTIYDPHHGGNPGASDYDVREKYCEVLGHNFSKVKFQCECPKWETAKQV